MANLPKRAGFFAHLLRTVHVIHTQEVDSVGMGCNSSGLFYLLYLKLINFGLLA